MKCSNLFRWLYCVVIACIAGEHLAYAQTSIDGRPAVNRDEVRSRLRPIGSLSAVDAFAPSRYPVRQVTMMQSTSDGSFVPAPSLRGSFGMPTGPLPSNPGPLPTSPSLSLPASPANALPLQPRSSAVGPYPSTNPPLPQQRSPQNLPFNNNSMPNPLSQPPTQRNPATGNGNLQFQQPGTFGPNSFGQPARPGASDYAPIAPPQLGNDFASMGNCRNISGPSTYRAAGVFGCNAPANYGAPIYGPTTYGAPTTYVAPPAQIVPAIRLPPGAVVSPASYAGSLPPILPGNPGYRPLLSFGQEKNPVQVGQGLLGQPVAYVPGQFIRNALRYISF